MIEITYKRFWIIPTYEVYFGYNNKKTYKKFSIVEIINICDDLDLKWFKKNIHHTWITNLNENLEQTFQSFSKTTRNEIRRAEKEWVEYIAIDNPSELELKKYYIFYNEFLKSKNLPIITYDNIKKFRWNLILTVAKKDWEILCYHAYINDKELKKIRLLHSCSHFRLLSQDSIISEGGGKRNLIGYANKWLHYFDMWYFKNIWYNEYDWWWIYNWEGDISKLKISKFKQSFSPVEIDLYNYQRMPFVLEILYKIKLLIWKIF